MKIIFFGNTTFGLPTLDKLNDSNHEILSIVTNKDIHRTKNKLIQTPIKQWSGNNNINLIQQDDLNCSDFIKKLKTFNADLFVVIAYKILPKAIFTLPEYGTMNLHASLLPKYRGAAPIQQALMNGDQVTGITTFLIEPKVDTGAIIFQEKISILPEDNFATLSEKMAERGGELVLRSIDALNGDFQPTPQNNAVATTAPKISKEMYIIDWCKDAKSIHNKVRGLSGTFTTLNQKRLKVFKTAVLRHNNLRDPGQIILIDKNRLAIACGEGALELIEIQMEGNKMMLVSEWMKGAQLSDNISFGA